MPDAFDDLSFFQAWFGWDSREEDEMTKKITKGAESDDIVNKLHRILSPFMMRRLKTDVTKEDFSKHELSELEGILKKILETKNSQGKDLCGFINKNVIRRSFSV